MINVGVIGVGYLGRHHARVYAELAAETGGIRLAAVADPDRDQADRIAAEYGCMSSGDYRDILGSVDAVSIVTPTITHYEIAMECIRAGKDMLVEKPVTTTVEEADDLIDAAEKAGRILQVGHLERFNPVITALYPMLDSPTFIEAERVSPFLGRGTDVDITLDLMIHDIDIALSLVGGAMVSDIRATGERILTEKIDIAKAWLEFDNGAQAFLTASRISPKKSRMLTVYQKDSYIIVDYQNMEIRRFFRDGDRIAEKAVTIEKKEPLKEELRSFIGSMGDRSRPLVCGTKGRDALKLALQIGAKIKQRW